MKKTGFAILLAFFTISFICAQDYNTGIGIRGGFDNGITIKHFTRSIAAFEGIIATRYRGLEVTGLGEIHGRVLNTDRLNWYYGFGGHVGFWNGEYMRWGEPEFAYVVVVGVDGILGLEYNFVSVPFNLSIDWKPAYNIFGYTGFWADGGAVSVRYIF